jgi:hypothetical protein
MHITLQNEDDYRNSDELYAVETAEYVYTECAGEHWAEQSVFTSFDENDIIHSVLLGSKNVTGPCFLTNFDTSNIERARAFPSFFY